MNLKTNQNYPKLDLLRNKEEITSATKNKRLSLAVKIVIVFFAVSIIVGIFFSFKVLSVGKNIFQSKEKESIFTQIRHLILSDNKKLIGEEDGRTNILLLGMGGGNHPGALLTDTIMIASIKYNENPEEPPQVALISIPRDLSVPFNSRYVRINSIYAYGEMQGSKDETYSGRLISQTINSISDLPIHYYLRIDFEGFKQIIDSLDGIEVDVVNSFYDNQYPTVNYGYQKISFEKGLNNLDGDLSLKYARSRHGIITDGSGSEGSDFARAKRQQQILTGIKDKAFSLETMANPKKINEILDVLGNHVRTDLEPWEMLRLVDLAKNIQNNQVINKVIDQESGFLTTTTGRNNAYLLMPINNNFDEIKIFCNNIFNTNVIQNEEAKVAVLNGTKIPELAKNNGVKLQGEDYNVIYIGNSIENDYEKTVIYDLSEGNMPLTLKTLKEKFNANISTNNFSPDKFVKNNFKEAEETDFVIILGLDSEI